LSAETADIQKRLEITASHNVNYVFEK